MLPEGCDATLQFRGRKGIQIVEDHCATRERFTYETTVRSWAEEDSRSQQNDTHVRNCVLRTYTYVLK